MQVDEPTINDPPTKELEQRDLKKIQLEKSNQGQEKSDVVVASLCDNRDNELSKEDELLSTWHDRGKKNDERSEALYVKTTTGKENRSAKKIYEQRGYQLELAGPAIDGKNSIICAPTGSGKTMTAALVCKSLAERKVTENDGPFKAVFVVCICNLVAQQTEALHEFLPELKVGFLHEHQFLDEALKEKDIVVLTCQILVNALHQGEVSLKTLKLIIFDECHHTNLNHPYNKLMEFYYREKINRPKPLPQILGMTASLGVGSAKNPEGVKDHYIQICANLDCTVISHVRDPKNKAELDRLNPKPSENQIKMVDKRPEEKEFYMVMQKLMEDIEKEYLQNGALQVPRGTQRYESTVSTLKQEAEKTKERAEEMVACEALLKMNSAWMIHDELRTKDALQLLNKYFRDNLESKPGAVEKELCQSYNVARNDLERIEEQETLEDWPLLKALHDLLRQQYDEDYESHGIVMASTIQYVDGLLSFLKDYNPNELISPKKFVGHRHNIENSMTEKEQEDVLLKFRKGEINLLVSTDVTQEGLDIPHCNFVIRFNFVSNEIGAVQARGRARAKDSKCFLIANRDSVNVEREMKNIMKERRMQDALDGFISSSDKELQELVKNCQEDIYKKLRLQDTRMEAETTKDGAKFSIHCRRCKLFLCSTEHLVQYGSHYICTDEAFKERIIVKREESPKEFREDTVIGKSVCLECKENIGSVLTYRRGSRVDGYTLGKDSVMWKGKDKDNFGAIKKWNNVPFEIRNEIRSSA